MNVSSYSKVSYALLGGVLNMLGALLDNQEPSRIWWYTSIPRVMDLLGHKTWVKGIWLSFLFFTHGHPLRKNNDYPQRTTSSTLSTWPYGEYSRLNGVFLQDGKGPSWKPCILCNPTVSPTQSQESTPPQSGSFPSTPFAMGPSSSLYHCQWGEGCLEDWDLFAF